MYDESVAKDGKLFAGTSGLLNTDHFQIADYRGDVTVEFEVEIAEWFGQATVRKGAEVTRSNPKMTISEVAFRVDTFAEICGIDPVRLAATKAVTAIVDSGNDVTATCQSSASTAFQDGEPVVIADRLGRFKAGFVDGAPPSSTSALVDDGAGAEVAGMVNIGVMANIDNSVPQYYTRADNALLDIGNAEDYSCMIWFERSRQNALEVLMAKTADASGTAYGTTAGWVLFVGLDNLLHFAVNDGVDAFVIDGSTIIPENEMHNVVVSYDESSEPDCKIYLDGYDDTGATSGATVLAAIGDSSNAGVFSIGAEADGGEPFDGYIAGAALWSDIVASAANALTIATTPLTEPAAAPTCWWGFIDAAAATVIDDGASAANALDLSLVGADNTNYGTHSRMQEALLTANLFGFDHLLENFGIGLWTVGDAASQLKKDKQYKKRGALSLRVGNTDASQAYGSFDVATTAAVEYHFHGWFRSPVTPNGASQLVDVDTTAALGMTVTQAGATTANTWYEIEFDFEAGDGATTIDLGSGSATDAEYGYWDSVQIYKNYVDAAGFETNIAGSDWTTVGAPAVDDADADEDSGALCYNINSDDPALKYVKQDVTVTSGADYTFTGRVKCGTAYKGMIVLSGAGTKSMDNDADTTNYVTVRHRFTAATTTLTIKIYGDGVVARFDNFSVIKVNERVYDFDELTTLPALQFMAQYTDRNAKTNQLFFNEAKVLMQNINFSKSDMTVHDLEVLCLNQFIHFLED